MPKITALGAVATGNIKAQLALKAAGTMNHAGSILAAVPAAARIGMRSVVVAVLLVISVKKVTERHRRRVVRMMDHPAIPERPSPITSDSPDP